MPKTTEPEEIKKPFEAKPKERIGEIYPETKIEEEKKEPAREIKEELVREQLEQEVKELEQDRGVAKETGRIARQIVSLGGKGKLQKLQEILAQKGVVFAVAVAKKLDDPYILDAFHDYLAQNQLYKKFIK